MTDLDALAQSLSTPDPHGPEISPAAVPYPTQHELDLVIGEIRSLLFPMVFDTGQSRLLMSERLGVLRATIFGLVTRSLLAAGRTGDEVSPAARTITDAFMGSLPEIRRLLCTDICAIYANDPAVDSYGEVVACYPVVRAMVHYRVAHQLLALGVPIIPRIITESAHSATGIDIHPGASIGEYFAIDHGTGVVIGETCVIGRHVTLYQGVTLGAKNFSLDSQGHPLNIPRHPVIEDHVTVYSNSTLLGRITVGHHSVIGGNVWLTHSVAPGSRILQSKAVSTLFTDGLGI